MRVLTASAWRAHMFAVAIALAAATVPAAAQQVPLAQLLPDLILREITLDSPPVLPGEFPPGAVPVGFTHVAHFSPIEANELNNPVVGIVQGFNNQLATQFSTFPLGSSSGGMTYVFDESIGTLRRGSVSFGPLFAERALTIGRRKLSVGVTHQRTSYSRFEGQNLDDGSIKFYLRHDDCCTQTFSPNVLANQPNGTKFNAAFEGDLIEAALSLRATTQTVAAIANYGVTDRLDIGLAVPFVRVNLKARVQARILRLSTESQPEVHTFEVGKPNATRTVERSGHATGLGDIVLRGKYHFLRGAGGGLAVAADLRLPTGDESELLGAGGTQAKFMLIASAERGRFGQHVNVGYTIADGYSGGTFAGLAAAPLPDEIHYSGGAEFVVTPKFTVMGDIVGRTLRRTGRLDVVTKTFQYAVPGLSPPPFSISLDEFAARPGDLTLLGTGGVKYNVAGNLLISGSVLLPITRAGLRSRVTTVIGLDLAF